MRFYAFFFFFTSLLLNLAGSFLGEKFGTIMEGKKVQIQIMFIFPMKSFLMKLLQQQLAEVGI